jgi:hypothetical protein
MLFAVDRGGHASFVNAECKLIHRAALAGVVQPASIGRSFALSLPVCWVRREVRHDHRLAFIWPSARQGSLCELSFPYPDSLEPHRSASFESKLDTPTGKALKLRCRITSRTFDLGMILYEELIGCGNHHNSFTNLTHQKEN